MAYSALPFTASTQDSSNNYLLGSNTIKDVFMYDVSTDSDGGAWCNDATAQTSSWYNEAFSSTRGYAKPFPGKCYIIATATGIDIIDATQMSLWMRFAKGATTTQQMIGQTTNSTPSSVWALNGEIYLGCNGSVGELFVIKFKTDSAKKYNATDDYDGNQTIANRNTTVTWSAGTAQPIINTIINDVSAAIISGKTYVAVATDAGVSIVNETDSTVVNIYPAANKATKSIALLASGNLYYARGAAATTADTLVAYYSLPGSSDSTEASKSALYNVSSIPSLHAETDYVNSINVTSGTSIVDGTSNTIYLATAGGAVVLNEKQASSVLGSVKYYDKNHITEEMVGAIKGQWGFWETASTDANQFKASGYLDTGKLGQAVSIYGNAAGTVGSTLTFNRGLQISGNNYEHINTNQGTISFWFKPSWNGNDGLNHFIYDNAVDATHRIAVYKSSSDNLIAASFLDGTNILTVSTATTTITSGTWYYVVARWSRNTIDGTNLFDLRVNNGTAVTSNSAWVGYAPAATSYIGSRYTSIYQANALIDDFAIFDRVLTTAEITALYNAGNGNEAGYVADSSLKFYAKMDGAGTLSPVTYNGGASASKLTRTSSELTGGTNLLTNGNMEAATAGAPTGWTAVGSPTLADAEAANILFDARSQKISVTGTAKGIYQTVTVVAGTNWALTGWIKSDGTNIAQIRIRDASNSVDLATLTITSATYTQLNSRVKAPVGCTSITVFIESGSAASYSFYVDNITLTPNLVDNGGMEGTYAGGIAPGWSAHGSPTFTDETTTIHSGGHSQKIVTTGTSQGIKQSITVISGNQYIVTGWLYASGSTAHLELGGAATTNPVGQVVNASVWTKVSAVIKAATTSLTIYALTNSGASGTFYIDDISVTPLDNVALSLKAWAPVSDSSALGNSLSVQGNATGVQSLAAGVRNTALTLDGSTGYLRQATIATNIGTLSYVGNDTTTASFTDDAATMSTYQASAPYTYMIVVTNSDNTVSWGYMGTASSGNITIFTTKTGSTRGWNGTAPVAGTKTPVGYEIRKTDFQINGSLTMGAWVKRNSSGTWDQIFSKQAAPLGYSIRYQGPANTLAFGVNNNVYATTSSTITDTNWHFIVATVDSSNGNGNIYVDGNVAGTQGSIPTPLDSSEPLTIGRQCSGNTLGTFVNGSIDEPFITANVLSAAQILDMYNKGLGALNHATKSDQKLQGTTNTVQAVWGNSDTIIAGTDTALSVIRQGKIGAYTDADSVVNYFTNATVPALVSANTVAVAVDGSTIVAGSSAAGMTKLVNLTLQGILNTGARVVGLITRSISGMRRIL